MIAKPSKIVIESNPPQLTDVDLCAQLKDKQEYNQLLKQWQRRMKQVQLAYFHQKKRALIVFEGWDAGGKGGAIRRITQVLDPRGFRVYPISAPTADEQGRHYFYRFVMRLPLPGTIAVFDRSYYGRVLVERVEKFASPEEWQRAYHEVNEWERTLRDDGVRIVKLFMHISPEEQLKRFEERLNNPLKRWKLTEEDIRNREKWNEYEEAINQMFAETSTEHAPWSIISGNSKWYARVQTLKTIVKSLESQVDISIPELDQSFMKIAERKLGIKVNSQ